MFRSLVIVSDLDIEGVAVVPCEADSPLVVDPNAVLPLSISFQLLQAVSGWSSEVLKRDRAMQQ